MREKECCVSPGRYNRLDKLRDYEFTVPSNFLAQLVDNDYRRHLIVF